MADNRLARQETLQGILQFFNHNAITQEAIRKIKETGAEQDARVSTQGDTQVQRVQDKGAQTLASIPEDYTALSGDVVELKSEITQDYIKRKKKHTDYSWNDGKYARYNTRDWLPDDIYSYIEVNVKDVVKIQGHTSAAPNSFVGMHFVDENNTFISGYRNETAGEYSWDYSVDVPAGAKILRISCRTAFISEFELFVTAIEKTILGRVSDTENEFSQDYRTEDEKLSDVTWYDGKYARYNTHDWLNDSIYSYAQIDVDSAQKIAGFTSSAPNSFVGMHFVDENNTFISGYRNETAGTYDFNYNVNVPYGAKIARVSCRTAYKDSFECTITKKVPTISKRVNDIQQRLDGSIAWVYPDTYNVVVGKQQRLYFNQICNTDMTGFYEVTCSGASSPQVSYTDKYIQFNFESEKSCAVNISFKTYLNVEIEHISMTINAVQKSTQPIKMMFIGDSLTQDGNMVKQFKTLYGDNCTLYGTRGVAPYVNEGRSSWSSYEYNKVATKNGVNNPFYNPSKQSFDFAYYMSNNPSYSDVTNVNILLGQNDGYYTGNIVYIKNIIDSIVAYNPDIKITIMGLFHLADDNTGCGLYMQSVHKYNALFLPWNQAIMNLASAYARNVKYVPQNLNLDTYYDFDRALRNASNRNAEQVTYFTNNVHPSVCGYGHFADVLQAYIN